MTVHRRDLLRRPLEGAAGVIRATTEPLSRLPQADAVASPVEPAAPPPRVTVIAYGPFELHEHIAEQPGAPAAMRGRFPVLWVHIEGIANADAVRAAGESFGLHAVALDAVLAADPRARIEEYGDALFLLARIPRPGAQSAIDTMSIFVGDGFVVSFQARPDAAVESVRARLRAGQGLLRGLGADFLACEILRAVVDGGTHLPERFDTALDALEEEITQGSARDVGMRLHTVRRDVSASRRAIAPLRDALATLLPEPNPRLSEPTRLHLRSVYEHLAQLVERLEASEEHAAALVEMRRDVVADRIHARGMALTIVVCVLISLGVLAGAYALSRTSTASAGGGNWPIALGAMGATAVALLAIVLITGRSGRNG